MNQIKEMKELAIKMINESEIDSIQITDFDNRINVDINVVKLENDNGN